MRKTTVKQYENVFYTLICDYLEDLQLSNEDFVNRLTKKDLERITRNIIYKSDTLWDYISGYICETLEIENNRKEV